MPIHTLTATPAPGRLIQVCAGCGATHTICLDRGGQKSKTGPFALEVGHTLVLAVDASAPVTLTIAASDFRELAHVTAAELAAKVNVTVPGVVATDDAGGLLLESATTGEASRLEVVGGTARTALGFATDGRADPCSSRPVLGQGFGAHRAPDPHVIALRRCNDCGANECLIRTLDCAAPELAGTHFAEHRKVVNALAEHCKASGWSHPELAELHAAETVRPVDLHTALSQGPVVLPPSPPPDKTLAAARAPRGPS